MLPMSHFNTHFDKRCRNVVAAYLLYRGLSSWSYYR